MSHIRNAKKNSEALKEETKKMNEKLQALRSLMENNNDKKKLNVKSSKENSKSIDLKDLNTKWKIGF